MRRWARVMTVALLVGPTAGCGGARPSPAVQPRTVVPRVATEKLVAGAVAAVSRLDEFDEQRAYEQAFDRLAQWAQAALPPADDWRPDPLLDTLPERLRGGFEPRLAQRTFEAGGDVTAIRDRRWLADIATAARGDAEDDVEVATRLFAWVVRGLALVGDPPMVPTADTPGTRWFRMGEVLLSGRASAAQRSWVFLELLRQAGIDGVMLATGGEAPRPWLPAAVIGGEAYLFEPTYGMPVPGVDGRPATARQAADDPEVLAALSLPDRPYPVKAADVAKLAVLVPADGCGLSRRMQVLDRVLEPRHGVRVADDATAIGGRAAAALSGSDHPIALWPFPFETELRRTAEAATVEPQLARELGPLTVVVVTEGPRGRQATRPLFTARVRDFRGAFDGPDGAKSAYLAARPSREAIQQAVAAAPAEQAAAIERLYRQMKEDATYWLGVVTLGEGQPEAAVDYLRRMTLENSPDSRWTDAARANLGRALAALGRVEEAVAVLREDGSPQRFGSRLLADRLERDATATSPPQPAETPTLPPPRP